MMVRGGRMNAEQMRVVMPDDPWAKQVGGSSKPPMSGR